MSAFGSLGFEVEVEGCRTRSQHCGAKGGTWGPTRASGGFCVVVFRTRAKTSRAL